VSVSDLDPSDKKANPDFTETAGSHSYFGFDQDFHKRHPVQFINRWQMLWLK